MGSYMPAKMVAVTLLLVGVWGLMAVSGADEFTAECSNLQFDLGGDYQKNVIFILQNLLNETPNQGEMDFKNQTSAAPVAYGAAHCFSSRSAASNVTCFNCLKQAIDALKPYCRNSVQATSGSAAAGCVLKYDKVPLKVQI